MPRPPIWIAAVLALATSALATSALAAEPLEFRLASDVREGEFQLEATHPHTGAILFLSERIALSSADIDTVRADDGVNGLPSLSLVFTEEGARRLAEVTGANVGAALAVVHDGRVITAPIIRAQISAGRAQIEAGGADLDDLFAALERSGVTIGEPIRRPPPPTEKEIGEYLRARCEEFLDELRAREGHFVAADSLALTALMEMSGTLDSYDVDPSVQREIWRTAETMWPQAAPRDWDARVDVLIGLIESAVDRMDLVQAESHAEELLTTIGQRPAQLYPRSGWGFADLVDAYLAEGRTDDAEKLCRRALATPVRDMMTGEFVRLVDLVAASGRVDEARALCEAELEDGDGGLFLPSVARTKLKELERP